MLIWLFPGKLSVIIFFPATEEKQSNLLICVESAEWIKKTGEGGGGVGNPIL